MKTKQPPRHQMVCGFKEPWRAGELAETKRLIAAAMILWEERRGFRPSPKGFAPMDFRQRERAA